MAIIGSMLAGAAQEGGKAVVGVGNEMLRGSILSELKAQEAAIQEQRDARLHESAVRIEGMRETAADARQGKDIASREGMQEKGFTNAKEMQSSQQTFESGKQDKDITSREKIASEALKSHEKLTEISQNIATGHLNVAQARAEIENNLKNVQLANAQEVQKLQKEYNAATDDKSKSAIRDKIQTLTGKDNDSFITVPSGYDEMGKPTGYQIFDKKQGKFVQPEAKTGGGKTGWDSTSGQVFKNGEVIGTAKTEAEARKLAAGPAQPAKPAAVKETAPDTIPPEFLDSEGAYVGPPTGKSLKAGILEAGQKINENLSSNRITYLKGRLKNGSATPSEISEARKANLIK